MSAAAPIVHQPVSLEEARAAQERIRGAVVRTPLARLDADDAAGAPEIHLKLEMLQPIRSFKLRGAFNAMAKAGKEALAEGVWTSSAGNMAQGVAWAARYLGVPCTVYCPDTAPRTKIANVRRYGGNVVEVPVMEWFEIFRTRHKEGAPGIFIHPYSDPDVMAGNAVAGLEILEDLPDVDAILVPWGGGGLCCGIASAVKALRPQTKVFAVEIETGAPLRPSLERGELLDVPFTPNFVDGIGSPFVNSEMFELARGLIDGALVVDKPETAAALRLIVERNRVVPEGAAATSVAAALAGLPELVGAKKIVAVLSGGNIDLGTLTTILQGNVP